MHDLAPIGTATLSESERLLVRAVAAGETADLSGATIRAAVVRAIVFGRDELCHVPRFGLRIRGGIIDGTLDLDGCAVTYPIVFTDLEIRSAVRPGSAPSAGLTLCDAHVQRLTLHAVALDAALVAKRAMVDNGLILDRVTAPGVVNLDGARIGHTLSLQECRLGDGRAALIAAGLHVDGSLSLRRSQFAGAVALPRARLASGLYAERAIIAAAEVGQAAAASEGDVRFDLESAVIDGDVLLNAADITGPAEMENLRVGGRFEAVACTIDAVDGGLNLSGLNVRHSLCLDRARIRGVLRLTGADIGKSLLANGADIDGGETAIEADLLRIGGNFEMTGARLVGQLRCPGADIEGQMRLTDAKIFGSELAIRADGSRVRGGCFFSRAIVVGMVRFPACEIANQFRWRAATIKVEHGPALLAAGTRFARDVETGGGFQTIGAIVLDQARIAGMLDLKGSRLRSAAVARAGSVQPAAQPVAPPSADRRLDEAVVSLVDADIGRLQMPERGDERPRGIVDLSRAHIGALEDWSATWPPRQNQRIRDGDGRDLDHLVLDGLVYDHLVNPAGSASSGIHTRSDDRAGLRRITWLDGQRLSDVAAHFRPQPWVQLASRLAAQGLAGEARRVAIERRRRERRSHAATALARWESRFLDWTALFGFNPWRTVLWSLAVVVIFAGIWSWAANHCRSPDCFDESVFVVSNRDAYALDTFEQKYPPFDSLAYSLDNFVPFVGFGYADHWRPNMHFMQLTEIRLPHLPAFISGETSRSRIFTTVTITAGGLLYFLSLLEQFLGIVFISLLVTGFTGLLRDEK